MKYLISLLICLIVLSICKAHEQRQLALYKDRLINKKTGNNKPVISNKVSYIHVLGLDGSGVGIVSTAIAVIAKTCNQHLIFQSKTLKSARHKARSPYFSSYLKNTKTSKYDTNELTIIEDSAFPIDGILTQKSSPQDRKKEPKNNIEWIYKQITDIGNIQQKYIYVNRDFYSTIMNSLRTEAEFEDRVKVLTDFQRYIDMEYTVINKKKEGLWKQVSYEWFRDIQNCTALVSALVDFAGWTQCDVDFACQLLPSLLPNTTTPAISSNSSSSNSSTITTTTNTTVTTTATTEAERIQYATNQSIPLTIPTLDISPKTQYQYNNILTTRKYSVTLQSLLQSSLPVSVTTIKDENIDTRYVDTGTPRNNVSFLYIVGVEGTGHHGVTPAIASIAKTCNYHVIYENEILRKTSARLLSLSYISALNKYKYSNYPNTNNILIIEDQSFPTDKERRVSTMENKKASGKYNLEWMYDRTVEVGVNMKFLHLTRDFYKSVASHPEFDVTFHRHAKVLYDFIWYIHSEYQLINQKKEGLWKQVSYEWFKEMKNCTAIVSAVIDFAGWNNCDVDFACQILGQTLKNST